MPKVGDKHFPYTEKGILDAKKYAKITGLSVDTEYREGGSIFNRQGTRVPGMRLDNEALPKAFVGGALKQIIKGVPKSLKRLFKGQSSLKSEARRVKDTFTKQKQLKHREKISKIVNSESYQVKYPLFTSTQGPGLRSKATWDKLRKSRGESNRNIYR